MRSLRSHYKTQEFGFADVDENRVLRIEKHEKNRRQQRETRFAANRQLIVDTTNERNNKSAVEDRLEKLVKWKIERDRRKKAEKSNKKPIFKVGIARSNNIPSTSTNTNHRKLCHAAKTITASSKRITRATEKRLKAKALAKEQDILSNKDISLMKNSSKKNNLECEKNTSRNSSSFAPVNFKFNAPSGLKQFPLFGRIAVLMTPVNKKEKHSSTKFDNITEEFNDDSSINNDTDNLHNSSTSDSVIQLEKLRISMTNNDNKLLTSHSKEDVKTENDESTKVTTEETLIFSPFVISSRGKSKARKEEKMKRGYSISPNNVMPLTKSILNDLNLSTEEVEEHTAKYFKYILQKETERLTELCQKWMNIRLKSDLVDYARERIGKAIERTFTLLNKKFERFRKQVLSCEVGKEDLLITSRDLQGFWNSLYVQIQNCDTEFNFLEKCLANSWADCEPESTEVHNEESSDEDSDIENISYESTNENPMQNKLALVDNVPNFTYNHLLKKKLENKNIKNKKCGPINNRRSGMNMTSVIANNNNPKTPEIYLDSSITYINSNQTPGKSILKRKTDTAKQNSSGKKTCKVNFDANVTFNTIPVDEEECIKSSLASALAKIENYDFDCVNFEPFEKVERKLDFEDDSFSEENNEFNENSQKSISPFQTDNLRSSLTTPCNNSSILKLDCIDNEDVDIYKRVLRNRTISSSNLNNSLTKTKTVVSEHNKYKKTELKENTGLLNVTSNKSVKHKKGKIN